jgi:hypothetical protein
MSTPDQYEEPQYPEITEEAPPMTQQETVDDQQLKDSDSIEPGKTTSEAGVNDRTKYIICIAVLAVCFILSFCSLAVFKNSGFGFAIMFIIAFGAAVGQMFLLVNHTNQFTAIKESKLLLIIAIVFAVVTLVNLIVGCASKSTAAVVIFLLVQWGLLLFYNFKILPNGIDGIKSAFTSSN